jgi:hypothetical protein
MPSRSPQPTRRRRKSRPQTAVPQRFSHTSQLVPYPVCELGQWPCRVVCDTLNRPPCHDVIVLISDIRHSAGPRNRHPTIFPRINPCATASFASHFRQDEEVPLTEAKRTKSILHI